MLNLGTLQFVLGVNTRALDAARNRIQNFGNAVDDAQRKANRGLDSNITQLRKIENTSLKALETFNKMASTIKNSNLSPSVKSQMLVDLGREYNNLTKGIMAAGKAADNTKIDRNFAAFNNAVNTMNDTLRTSQKEIRQAKKEADQLAKVRGAQTAASHQARFNELLGVNAKVTKTAAASADVFRQQLKGIDEISKSRFMENANAAQARFNNLLGVTKKKSGEAAASAAVFQNAFKQQKTDSSNFNQQSAKLAQMGEQAKNLEAALQRAAIKLPQATGPALAQMSVQIESAFNKMASNLSGGKPLDPAAFQRASQQYTAAINKVKRDFQMLVAESRAPAIADWERFKATLRNLGATTLLINGHLGGLSTRMFALGSLVGSLGVKMGLMAGAAAGAGIAMHSLVGGTLNAQLEMEKSEKALTALTGSSVVAASHIKYLRDVAYQTGAGFLTLTNSYTRYFAAAKASGMATAQIKDQFRTIAIATGTLSLSVDDTMGVFRAFEQMLSKGQVQAEELRNQLGDRLPGAFAIAAGAMGVTTSRLSAMTKAGELLSADFVPKMMEAMKIAYGLNIDKPIDTLQAAINRGKDSILLFYDAFNKNTEVVNVAKRLLSGFSASLDFLSNNMAGIIRSLKELTAWTGAVAAAWAAWKISAYAGAALQLFNALRLAIPAVISLTTFTKLLTAAQVALNAAMLSNPIGAVIGLIVRLGIASAGAVAGYKLMDKWVNANNDSLGDTTEIQKYINQQKRMGFQIRDTTQALLQQAAAMARQAATEAQEGATKLRERVSYGVSSKDALDLAGKVFTGQPHGTVWDVHRENIQKETKELQEITRKAKERAQLVRDLMEINKLPDEAASGSSTTAGGKDDKDKGKKGKAIADEIDGIKQLITNYQNLQEKMRGLSGGPDTFLALDSLHQAKEALDGLTKVQLSKADAAMKAAGLSAGTLEERLQGLIMATSQSERSIDAFVSAWDKLDDIGKDLAVLDQQLRHVMGGGSWDDVEKFKTFQEALDMVKDMDSTALNALANRLKDMGVMSRSTTVDVDEVAAAIERLMSKVGKKDSALDALKDIDEQIATMRASAAASKLEMEGLRKGLSLSDGSLDSFVRGRLMVSDFGRALEAAGVPADILAERMRQLSEAVADDALNERLAEKAKAMQDFREDVSYSMGEAVASFVTGASGLKNAAKRLLDDLLRLFTEKMFTKPLFNFFDSLLSNISTFKFSGGGHVKAGVKAATGGHIRGQGTSTSDSIPAWLSDNEFVMRSKAVDKWGVPLLHAMNNGTLPSFSGGGSVGKSSAGSAGGNLFGFGGGTIKIEVAAVEGAMFIPQIRKISTETAQDVVIQGFQEYDEALPDRVIGINNSPRDRG